MAGTLKVKIQEDIILDNQDYGSKRIFEIASIDEIYKRIVTVPAGADTTIANFAAAVSSEASAFDVNDVRYIRLTNLDSSNPVNVALIGASDNAQFVLEAGKSLMFGTPDDFMLGETDTSPAFASFEDLAKITVDSGSNAVNVELFIASV
tara:strand:- start:997 stop:1446 length:450 start_codon:yes stop_codon:yes gene_type:complete